jgi:hypothetical protein
LDRRGIVSENFGNLKYIFGIFWLKRIRVSRSGSGFFAFYPKRNSLFRKFFDWLLWNGLPMRERGKRKREEGRGKREEGRGKREEKRGKGRGKIPELISAREEREKKNLRTSLASLSRATCPSCRRF